MTRRRETVTLEGHRLDAMGLPHGKPVQFEVYADNGEWVDPSLVPSPALVDPADAPITVTRSELADIVAAAVTAAGVAQQRTGATSAKVQAAARAAVMDA